MRSGRGLRARPVARAPWWRRCGWWLRAWLVVLVHALALVAVVCGVVLVVRGLVAALMPVG